MAERVSGGDPLVRIRDALLWPLRWSAQRASLLLAEGRSVDGFRLYDATGGGRPEALLDALQRALELLRELDPRRYRGLRRHVPHLVLVRGGATEYYRQTRSGMMRAPLVEGRPPPTVAVELVGLGARACLANRLPGYRFGGERGRRALRRIAREQMAFAARLDPERFSGLDELRRYLEDAYARAGSA